MSDADDAALLERNIDDARERLARTLHGLALSPDQWLPSLPSLVDQLDDRFGAVFELVTGAYLEARNALPDVDDDQATAVEQFASMVLRALGEGRPKPPVEVEPR